MNKLKWNVCGNEIDKSNIYRLCIYMPLLHFFSTTADMPDLVWCESTNE